MKLNILFLLLLCTFAFLLFTKTAYGILWGHESLLNQYPYQARLHYSISNQMCGGFIFNEDWVATTASCLNNTNSTGTLTITVGDISIGTVDPDEQTVVATKVIFYESWHRERRIDDIGMAKVKPAIKFTQKVKAAEYTVFHVGHDQILEVSGWGSTTDENGPPSDRLRTAMSFPVPQPKCVSIYQEMGFHITPSQLCAGEGGGVTCTGDLGAPLTLYKEEAGQYVVGIASYGGPNCGSHPTVFTDIQEYVWWMNRTSRNN